MILFLLLSCGSTHTTPPAAGLDVRLRDDGAHVGPMHLATARYGRRGLMELAPTPLRDDGCAFVDRGGGCVAGLSQDVGVRSERGAGLRTWWREVPDGLQQGWVIDAPPPDEEAGPLRIEVAVRGATVTRRADGDLLLQDASGQRWRYGGLAAWDAEGQDLAARMERGDDGIVVTVSDEGARYPITVDPVLSTAWDTVNGLEEYGYFGWTIHTGFDLDGNGYPEILGYALNAAAYNGDALLYMGSAAGYAAVPDLQLTGQVFGEGLGFVSAAGDLDGDGYTDLALGTNVGRVDVHLGGASGTSRTPYTSFFADPNYATGYASALAIADLDANGVNELYVTAPGSGSGIIYVYTVAGPTPQRVALFSGFASGDRFGAALAVGDVDADGYEDLLVGAPGVDTAGPEAGAAFILGGGSGVVPNGYAANQRLEDAPPGSEAGSAVAVADLNGDGRDDIVVGAPLEDTDGVDAGAAYVYLGGQAGGDPYGSLVARLPGRLTSGRTGLVVDGAGDVNGDGYGDLILGGDWNADESFLLYAGRPDGVDPTPEQDFYAYGAADIDGLGDVDGDGYDDLAASAPLAGAGGIPGVGVIHVRLGFSDDDRDGFGGGGADTRDCDDDDSAVSPDGVERVGDGVDQDCDGTELCYTDADDDGRIAPDSATITSSNLACDGPGEAGAGTPADDCDDDASGVYPGATEIVGDGVDQDCDGAERCYVDADADGHLTPGAATISSTNLACDGVGEASASTPADDCDDANGNVYPGATEGAGDEVDEDCDGAECCYADADNDGYRDALGATIVSADADCDDDHEAQAADAGGDCDDSDALIHPGAAEALADAVDQDCDGTERCYADADGDGVRTDRTVASADLDCDDPGEAAPGEASGDCDDAERAVYPGAVEAVGDGVDQDCDGGDVCPVDGDLDGYVNDRSATIASADLDCADPGEAAPGAPSGDCDDADPSRHPGEVELVDDGVDSDCDGAELCFEDADNDGFRNGTTLRSADLDCGDAGEAAAGDPEGDCQDEDATVNPAAAELVGDGVDSDCDGAELCYADADDDGYRTSVEVRSEDTRCDGAGEARSDQEDGDCADADPGVNPGAAEVCDGVDNDCDGAVDVGAAGVVLWYADADADGYSDLGDPIEACEAPEGYGPLSDLEDCDDTDAAVYPDGDEVPGNGIDEDCDGQDGVVAEDTKGGCSCDGSGGGSIGLLGVAGALVLRRRRPLPASV